jgi:tetratricopeptide (TPR) repeat protein
MVSRRGARPSTVFGLSLTLAAATAAGRESPSFAEALAQADEQYARRAEGARGALALPGPVEEAIAGYRQALSLRPDSTEARSGLVRALFFRATFCGSSPEEKKRIFEEARRIGEEGVARLDAAAAGTEGAARAAALRRVPGAGEVVFWAAVAWGEWALGRRRLAAVRAGAPGRIRDLAQLVIDVDPDLEEGGGYRVLGRLHDQSPSIPFVTGWVSRETSLRCLRQAYAAFPDNTVNQYFLAEAILRHDHSHREEARTLLARLAAVEPKEEYRVEDAHYAALARDLLARMR